MMETDISDHHALIFSILKLTGEKGEVVSKNEGKTTQFNNYFNDITKGLNIKECCISDKLSDGSLVNAI